MRSIKKTIPSYNISVKLKHGKIRLFTEDKNSQLPITEHQDTSGLILTAAYDVDIPTKSRRLVYTRLKCEIPTGTVGWVTRLSGLAISKMIDVTPMILDTSYHGQISLIVYNHNDKTYTLKAGGRIAVLTFGLQSTAQIDLPKTQSVTPKIHLRKRINPQVRRFIYRKIRGLINNRIRHMLKFEEINGEHSEGTAAEEEAAKF